MTFRKVFLHDEEDKIQKLDSIKEEKSKTDSNLLIEYEPKNNLNEKMVDKIEIDENFFKFIEDIVKRYLENNFTKNLNIKVKKKVRKNTKISQPKSKSLKTESKNKKNIKTEKKINWIYK